MHARTRPSYPPAATTVALGLFPTGPNPWELEYEAPFAEIWAHDSYVAAGLPPDKVPNLALVDPDNHGVVYFFQGTRLFGVDVRARRVVACGDCVIGDTPIEMGGNLSSRFVEAWVPPEPGTCSQPARSFSVCADFSDHFRPLLPFTRQLPIMLACAE